MILYKCYKYNVKNKIVKIVKDFTKTGLVDFLK